VALQGIDEWDLRQGVFQQERELSATEDDCLGPIIRQGLNDLENKQEPTVEE
jgi:hypothetical protein